MTRPLTNWHSAHAEHLTRGERAAALAEHDYEMNLAAKREIEELMEINRMQLDLLRELRRDVPSIAAPEEGAGR